MKSELRKGAAGVLAAVLALAAAGSSAAWAAGPGTVDRVVPPVEDLHQLGGLGISQCLAFGSSGLLGAGLQQQQLGGLSQILPLGSGGFYNPYYAPNFSSAGVGTIGGFLNFTMGRPSQTAALAASPFCAGLGIGTGAVAATGPTVVRDFRLNASTPPISLGGGLGGAGLGASNVIVVGGGGTGLGVLGGGVPGLGVLGGGVSGFGGFPFCPGPPFC